LIASPDGVNASVTIHQDAKLYVSLLSRGQQVRHELAAGRFGWLQVAKGAVEMNRKALNQGDGAATDERTLVINASEDSEILLFDLA
jgi:redox-sensitive bicupin YhaK (pirin superfamily)